jgi:hypothetical protein
MSNAVQMQDIEEMRSREGIEDPELRAQIGGLRRGDLVKITFLTGAAGAAGETLLVKITSLGGGRFRGKLVSRPASSALAHLWPGSPIAFTAAHIHSLSNGALRKK